MPKFNVSRSRVLRSVFLPIKPWSIDSEDVDEEYNHVFSGIIGKMVDIMSSSLNLTFEMSESHDWSSFDNTEGEWQGLLKQLHDREFDIVVGPVIPGEHHIEDFHMFPPYYEITSYLTMASTNNYVPSNFFSFLMTFQKEIWYGIIVTLAALIIASSLSDHFSNVRRRIRRPYKKTLSMMFWMYLSALCFEGYPRPPIHSRTRFILGVWLLSVLVLLNSFSGQFKALLLVSHDGNKMKDVNDLACRTDLLPTFPNYWASIHCFRDTDLKPYKKIWETVEKHGLDKAAFAISELHNPDVYQRVKNGTTVVIADPTMLKVNFEELCHEIKGPRSLYTFEGVCSNFFFAFFAARGLDPNIYDGIHKRTRWLMESYLIDKWIDDATRDFWKCFYKPDHNDAKALSMNNLFGAFALLLLLQLAAGFVLIGEIIMK